jgi:RNA polymerase sigma-70 factor (ECF subfamily)
VGLFAVELSMTRADDEDRGFLSAFHAGERWAIEASYREHASRVIAAARRLVGPVDAETITHEVFYRLLSNSQTRASFRGGNLGAWLCQVAVRSAVDDLRKRRRETSEPTEEELGDPDDGAGELDAKILIDRFRAEVLAPEDRPLFEARFIRHLPQRDAARELGIPRSTLTYQEQRIREQLERFLMRDE